MQNSSQLIFQQLNRMLRHQKYGPKTLRVSVRDRDSERSTVVQHNVST